MEIERAITNRPIEGKCDWCMERSAVITDGTYVYCSVGCQKEFENNAFEAIEERNKKIRNYNV